MNSRERKYHSLNRYLKSPIYNFNRTVYNNMWEWGIAGTKVWLDENGKVQLRILSLDECLEMEPQLPIDGITIIREEVSN